VPTSLKVKFQIFTTLLVVSHAIALVRWTMLLAVYYSCILSLSICPKNNGTQQIKQAIYTLLPYHVFLGQQGLHSHSPVQDILYSYEIFGHTIIIFHRTKYLATSTREPSSEPISAVLKYYVLSAPFSPWSRSFSNQYFEHFYLLCLLHVMSV
jgi:hypothetical protein